MAPRLRPRSACARGRGALAPRLRPPVARKTAVTAGQAARSRPVGGGGALGGSLPSRIVNNRPSHSAGCGPLAGSYGSRHLEGHDSPSDPARNSVRGSAGFPRKPRLGRIILCPNGIPAVPAFPHSRNHIPSSIVGGRRGGPPGDTALRTSVGPELFATLLRPLNDGTHMNLLPSFVWRPLHR